jgi:hypothetical protein
MSRMSSLGFKPMCLVSKTKKELERTGDGVKIRGKMNEALIIVYLEPRAMS